MYVGYQWGFMLYMARHGAEGFQSNAKTITVGDELIETAINMKR